MEIRFSTLVTTAVNHSSLSVPQSCRAFKIYTPVFALFLLLLQACATVDDQAIENLTYTSVWSQLYPATLQRDALTQSLQDEFLMAATAQTAEIADQRWTKFLSDWGATDGAYEDAMHARLVDWAKLEKQRLQHLMRSEPEAMEAATNKLLKLAAEME